MIKKVLITLIFGMMFWAGTTLAQESAEKYGVQFPVAELGNCDSISECRSFCEDPVNRSSCVSFAKQKGFYKEQDSRQQEMLQKAGSELGCSSPDACRDFCHQEANFDKCSSFAKKHNFSGGHTEDPGRLEILQKAKQVLGCDSPDSCRAICQEEGNRQKCSEFAKDSGLRGGEHRVGPGGCTSQDSCRSFCSDPTNFNACSSFGGGPGGPGERGGPGGPGGQFRGPGGCTSEESCRSHCEQNPQDCKIIPEQFSGAGPNEGRGKFEEFCKDNPERCRGEGDKFRGFEPGGNPEQFCKDNPDKCREGNFKQGEFGGREPQGPGIEGQPKQEFPNQDQMEKFGRPPEGFRPQDMPKPQEGFRPSEGTNYPPEGQRPSENFSPPDNGGSTAPPPSPQL